MAGFSEKITEHKMCVLISSTNMSDMLFLLKRTERHVIKKSRVLQVQYSLSLSDFNVNLCQRFIEQYSNIIHHDVMPSESSAVQRGQMDGRKDRPNEANTDGPTYPQFTAA